MSNASINAQQKSELVAAAEKVARENNWNAEDVLTIMSFETGGTLDPWQAGRTTKWGQHRGLIQWGNPQASKYGVSKNTSITKQVEAAAQFMKDHGVKPGDGILPMYASINAGDARKINASDAKAGGTWGTVLDKVSFQMNAHREAAKSLISGYGRNPYSSNPVPAAAPLPSIDGATQKWNTSFDQYGQKTTTPQFAPGLRGNLPSAYAQYGQSRSLNAQPSGPMQTAQSSAPAVSPVSFNRENLGADRINRSAYSEYGRSRAAAPSSPASFAPVSVQNVHSNFDRAGRFTGQATPTASSLPSDMAAQYASDRPGAVPSKPSTAVTAKAISSLKDAYSQYAASMVAAPSSPASFAPVSVQNVHSNFDRAGRFTGQATPTAALPDDPVPISSRITALDKQPEKSPKKNNPTGVPDKVVAQSLLGGLVSGVAAPVGSNYQGEWTPAAGGNKVAESIGVGIGGESLRGVTNQYGATSMLGEGGSRTYGGPGGSSGK